MKGPKMVIAGGSGYMGGLFTRYFEERGWECVVLTRHPSHPVRDVYWDGETRGKWENALEGMGVLINLCGKSVNCRYHKKNRKKLLESRVLPTRLLGKAVSEMKQPPGLWIQASTATLYRHTFGEPWQEDGEIGSHPDAKDAFSIDLATTWEKSFLETIPPGVRPLLMRSAMVLGRDKNPNNVLGVLRKLTRLGLGGRMGHGRQFVSWIHEQDLCRAVEWSIDHPALSGPVNFAAPQPLPNREMMAMLRETLGRPFGLSAPEWLLEMGAYFLRTETELIIKSRRVIPGALSTSGFRFEFPSFQQALADLL